MNLAKVLNQLKGARASTPNRIIRKLSYDIPSNCNNNSRKICCINLNKSIHAYNYNTTINSTFNSHHAIRLLQTQTSNFTKEENTTKLKRSEIKKQFLQKSIKEANGAKYNQMSNPELLNW